MAEVRGLFEQAAAGEGLAALLQKLTEIEQVALEKIPASPNSPGVVNITEGLIRALDQPVHFGEGGEIKPTAFGDSESRGLSVNRQLHITADAAMELARARVLAVNQRKTEAIGAAPPITRSTVAYAILNTAELRAMSWSAQGVTRRAFGVYDTAKSDDISHGDVCVLVAGKHAHRSVREKLYQHAKLHIVRLPVVGADK